MRLICADRDRLWKEYDDALRAYAENVFHASECGVHSDPEFLTLMKAARVRVYEHCRGHGCEPGMTQPARM